jgi:nucleotide-binding universal stress UspA family protein
MTTSYKQILVHLDAGRRIPLAVATARRLVQEQGAALAALDVIRPALASVPVVAGFGAVPVAALAEHRLFEMRMH